MGGFPCCCEACPYCESLVDSFDASLSGDWSQIRGTWATAGGVLECDDGNGQVIWYGQRPCSPKMVVICNLGAVGDGQTVYVITNYGSGNTNTGDESGYLFAKITQSGVTFDVSIGEVASDGGTENILDGVTGISSFSGYIRLCYNSDVGKLSLVNSSAFGATSLLEGWPTLAYVKGRRAGLGLGASISTACTFNDFAIYAYDPESCQSCEATCPDCCDDGLPASIDVTIPASEFTDDECDECDALNGATFNLMGASSLTFGCADVFEAQSCHTYYYTDATFCAGGERRLTITGVLQLDGQGNCRLSVCVHVLGSSGFEVYSWQAIYQSEWEAVSTCAAKSWSCDFVSLADEGEFCNVAQTSLTAGAA